MSQFAGSIMQGLGGAMNSMGNMAQDMMSMAFRGAGTAMAGSLGGQYAGAADEATNAANAGISSAYNQTNADLQEWLRQVDANQTLNPDYIPSLDRVGWDASGSYGGMPTSTLGGLAQQAYAGLRDTVRDTSANILRQGESALGELTDNVATRLSGLASSAVQSLQSNFAEIDARVASGELTPAAAAALKTQNRVASGQGLVDSARQFHADLATQRSNIRLNTQNAFANYMGIGTQSLLRAGEDVVSGFASDRDHAMNLANLDRDVIVALGQNRINDIQSTYNNTMQTLGNIMSYGMQVAGMLAGIGQPSVQWNLGQGLMMAGQSVSQIQAANAAQPDSGGMF